MSDPEDFDYWNDLGGARVVVVSVVVSVALIVGGVAFVIWKWWT